MRRLRGRRPSAVRYSERMDETSDTTTDRAADHVVDSDALVEDELLVEEISIDGMCGVY